MNASTDKTDAAIRDGMRELARTDPAAVDATRVGLGDRVGDLVTNFAGIATARLESLHGHSQILVEAPAGTMDMAPQKGQSEWFDERRLVIIDDAAPLNPAVEIRADAERLALLEVAVEKFDELLDRTPCFCTLADRSKCAKHAPDRPKVT